jgi:hypothetical protein
MLSDLPMALVLAGARRGEVKRADGRRVILEQLTGKPTTPCSLKSAVVLDWCPRAVCLLRLRSTPPQGTGHGGQPKTEHRHE